MFWAYKNALFALKGQQFLGAEIRHVIFLEDKQSPRLDLITPFWALTSNVSSFSVPRVCGAWRRIWESMSWGDGICDFDFILESQAKLNLGLSVFLRVL